MPGENNESVDNEQNFEYVGNDAVRNDASVDNAAESEALAMGWKPLAEFKGDPDKWTDAETYVESHSRHNGVLKKANEKILKELDEVKSQMKNLDAAHKSIFDMQMKKAKEEFEQSLAYLKAQKREARRTGDLDTADELDEQIDSLKERGPETPVEPAQTAANQQDPNAWRQNPILAEWADRNAWFTKDKAMTAYAVTISQELRQSQPKMSFEDILQTTTHEVRKEFAHKFTSRRNPVEGGTVPSSSTTAPGTRRSYATLPAEAKRQCDQDVGAKLLTKDQWVDMYYSYDDRRKK